MDDYFYSESDSDIFIIRYAKKLVSYFKSADANEVYESDFINDICLTLDEDFYWDEYDDYKETYVKLIKKFEELWGSHLIHG